MNKVLFNLNDVALLLVIFECFLLGLLLLILNHGRAHSRYLLSIFLFAVGLDALDTLIFWSVQVKQQLVILGVYPFFVFKFSVFLAAPTLYLYVKSILYYDFKLSWRDILHFLPALLFPLYLLLLFRTFGQADLERSLFDFEMLFHHPLFQTYLWTRNIAYVGYGCASLMLIARYQEKLKEDYSNIKHIDQSWLTILVGGFLLIWTGVFTSYLSHRIFESSHFSNTLGVIGNYLNFIFINSLVVYSLVKSRVVHGVAQNEFDEDEIEIPAPSSAHIAAIEHAMEKDRPYINPVLTLEELARHLGLSPRYVSAIINGHYHKNFFEFINEYRAETARSLLEVQEPSAPMSEVMTAAGFNSKATFNRFFKKSTGMTPTEYRSKYIPR